MTSSIHLGNAAGPSGREQGPERGAFARLAQRRADRDQRAQAVMDKAFGAPSSNATAVLVLSPADGRPLTAGNLAAAGHAVAALAGMEARHQAAGPPQARPAAVRVSPGVQASPNHLVAWVPDCAAKLTGARATR